MSTGFKEALEREIGELERSLEADPRFIKLRELQRVAGLYSPTAQAVDSIKRIVGALGSAIPPRTGAPRFYGGGEMLPTPDGQRRVSGVLRQKVLEDAESILRGRTEPTKTADLYDSLVAAGHEIGGDDPKSNLSAMLSKSPLFRSHKRAGWTLVESQSTAPDDDTDEPEEVSAVSPGDGEDHNGL